jgi:O2-independent ubiquinone biosynthesis accessory factor UbiT
LEIAKMPAALRALLPPRPTLPAPFAWPLSLIPGPVHSTVLTQALNVLFAAPIQNDEFEFLRDRVLAIEVRDARVEFRFCFTGPAGFAPRPAAHSPDLTISGALYDFLALVTRREDSDTLFFSRRVVMAGDTALGLELKNWLDGTDLDALGGPLPPLVRAINGLLGAYERLGGH